MTAHNNRAPSATTRKRGDTSRPYRSALRAEQQERTREILLDAVVRRVVDNGVFDLTLPAVAREAGTSVPTVYRHFPTIDALLDALAAHITERVGVEHLPDDADGLAQHARALFRACDDNEPLVRARLLSPHGREVQKRVGKQRPARLRKLVQKAGPRLGPAEVRAVAGVVRVLLSSTSWSILRDEFDLDGDLSGRAVAWAIDTLLRSIRSGAHPLEEDR